MSGVKHTPGPWHVEEEGEVLVIVGPRENCSRNGKRPSWEMAKIDNYVFWDEPETEAEDRANATLIAAAPTLLHELEMQVRNCPLCKGTGKSVSVMDIIFSDGPHEKGDCTRCASSRAAIAQAKGLTP